MTQPNTMLESLAERGAPRGATTVLRDARRDAVRHRRRRVLAGGATVAAALTGVAGAAVFLTADEEARPLAAGPAEPPATGGPQTLTGMTIEGHDGFDRIVLQFNVDNLDMGSINYSGFAPGPECEDFHPLDRPGSNSASETPVVSARASGEDGLVPGLADVPIAGDTTYVEDVTALCEYDGYAWVTIAYGSLVDGGVIIGPDSSLENPTRFVTHGRCAGDDPGEMYVDVYETDTREPHNRPPGTCAPGNPEGVTHNAEAETPSPGPSPEIQETHRAACAAGSMAGCDELWHSTPPGSELEAFAETCGGRAPEGGHESTCEDAFGS